MYVCTLILLEHSRQSVYLYIATYRTTESHIHSCIQLKGAIAKD